MFNDGGMLFVAVAFPISLEIPMPTCNICVSFVEVIAVLVLDLGVPNWDFLVANCSQ